MLNQTFVGRDSEMAKLEVYFDKVQTSQTCQVCLIEGNAGVGKTTLTDQFAQLLEKKYIGKAFTVVGKCNPQTGPNDNYLPFRQILSQFTGTQTRLLQNSISNRPNWFRNFSDSAILALVEFGPDLIGTFVPGATLMARLASTVASTSLKKNAERKTQYMSIPPQIKEDEHEKSENNEENVFPFEIKEKVCFSLKANSQFGFVKRFVIHLIARHFSIPFPDLKSQIIILLSFAPEDKHG